MKVFTKTVYRVAVVLCLFTTSLFAQTTITISPGTNWTDVCLLSSQQPGREYYANTNYASYARIAASAWTASGYPFFRRSLIRFDLAAIPSGSTITNATLYFYSDPTMSGPYAVEGNSKLSGSNAIYLEKVTSNWNENTVTWNTQPTSTATGRIWYPESSSTTENIQIDIKSFVQSWINSPATNYGMKMKLENELHYRSRNYASEEHSNTSIRPKLVITYTAPASSSPLRARLDHIFGGIDKSQIPTGFLEEYGAPLLPLEPFNGVLTDSNRFDITAWRMVYGTLYTSRIYGSNPLQSLAQVNTALKNATSANAVPVAMLMADYNYLKPDAVDDNLLDVVNDQLIDVPGRTQSPYAQRLVFAASPSKNFSPDGHITLIFKSSLFYNVSNKTLSTIEVDFADGNGYRSVSWDTPITASYGSTGLKQIKIRVSFTDATTMECYADLEVQEAASGLARYAPPQDFIETFASNGSHSGGRVFVRYDENDGEQEINKPLIVVEGYDISSIAPDLQKNYGFEDFIDDLDEDPNPYDFNEQLDDVAGYDLIFLDFNTGTDDIRRNAELLEDVIAWVNQEKADAGSVEQNVVMGISMGGLVARYALAEMTKDGNNPQTRLLITHDSPHQGANTPLGIQFLTRAAMDIALVGELNSNNLIAPLEQANAVLDAPATQQLLILRAMNDNGGVATNTFLAGDYRNKITFSANDIQPAYRIVATSLGAECGQGQEALDPYDELIRVNGKFFISPLPWLFSRSIHTEVIVNALPDGGPSKRIMKMRLWVNYKIFFINVNINLTDKSANSPSNTLPWDSAPGGTQNVAEQAGGRVPTKNFKLLWFLGANLNSTFAEDFCFVPTVSALDVTTINESALNAVYTAGISASNAARVNNFITHRPGGGANAFNEAHPRFTARNAEWLFNEMEMVPNNTLNCSEECEPEGIAVLGASTICTDETYTINELPPGYSISWAKSSNLAYVSGQNTLHYTVEVSASSGTPWVEARLTGPCGVLTYRKNLVRGDDGIAYSDITITGNDAVCSNEWYIYNAYNQSDIPIAEYDWIFPYGWTILEQNDAPFHGQVKVLTPSQVGDGEGVDLAVTNVCGTYQPDWYYGIDAYDMCSSNFYSVYPNPSNEYFEVSEAASFLIEPEHKEVARFGIKRLKLYNNLQEEVKSIPFKAPMTRVEIGDLPPGHYILHIIKTDDVDKKHIFIQKRY